MARKTIIVVWLIALALASFRLAGAQQVGKVPRVGFLGAATAFAVAARVEAFRQGLRELGYVEGKNIVIQWRFAEGKVDRLPALIADLARIKVEVIVTAGGTVTRAAKEASVMIPIVMGFDNDPVGSAFVASLAHPGGNITGLSSLAPEISGKQLELLKETIPKLSRITVFGTSIQPATALSLRETQRSAEAFKVQIQYLDIQGPKDIENAFQDARKGRADAVLVLGSPILESHRTEVTDLAAKNRLPAIYHATEFVEAGGLMTYSVSLTDLFRRAATYVDKILKGAKPGDLPVEQPTKFDFIVNLKAAKQIGLTIPPNVLARADRVIK
jgi:putative ABC transport system substrate-binding protein